MKFNRTITACILGAVCVSGYAFAASSTEESVNRNLKIKDVFGNREELGSLSLESVMKVGSNKFEKVSLNQEGVKFTPTQYDELRDAGEQVLNNKDLLRGKQWAPTFEKKDILMFVEFNPKYPWGSKDATVLLGVKDKKTGEVEKKEISLSNISLNNYIGNQKIFEIAGELYYYISEEPMNGGSSTNKLFKIDVKNMDLVENVNWERPQEAIQSYEIPTDGTNIYTAYEDMNTLTIVAINPATKEMKEYKTAKLEGINGTSDSLENFNVTDNSFIFFKNKIIQFMDKKSLKITQSIKIGENFSDSISIMKQVEKDGKLYVTYNLWGADAISSYVAVIDMKLGKVTYEGKLPLVSPNKGNNFELRM